MKHLKILGLAAVAATALVAFGSGSASATVLCKTTTTPCGAANHYSEGTELKMELAANATSVIETTDASIQDICKKSTLRTKTSNTGSSTATINGSFLSIDLTFGECTHTTAVELGGTLEIHHIAGSDNGTITASGFQITASLAGSCSYGPGAGGTDIGTLIGGTNVVSVSAVLTKVGGGFTCPTTVKWTATYGLTAPATAVYVEPS